MAVASAAALVGALGTGITFAAAASTADAGAGVTFSSQPGVAQLVAHYTVSPAERPEDSSNASDNRQLPRLTKQGHDTSTRTSAADTSAGPKSDNTNNDSSASSTARLSSPASQSEGGGGGDGNKAKASFIGQASSQTTCSYFGPGCNPPDMALAASPRFVLQGVNTQFEVLDTSGEVQPGWPVSAQSFFGVPNVTNADGTPCDVAHKSQPFLSDPRALYDARDHRFWAAVLQVQNGLGVVPDCPFKSVYFVAVSQTSNPRGDWNVYEFNMSLQAGFAADFTQIGLNSQGVYFSGNMFQVDANGNVTGFYAEVFEANKAKMESGKGGFTADGFFNLLGNGPGIPIAGIGPFIVDTVQPSINIDNTGGPGEVFASTVDGPDLLNGHLCTSAADACSGLILWRMTNPIAHDSGGRAPKFTGTYVPSKPFVFSPAADQPSCNRCVDANANDLRISATTVVRDGVLYGAFETALNNGTQIVPGIEWLQINLSGSENGDSQGESGGITAQTGYYNLSGDAAVSYPALMPDGHGNVVMLFEHMSHTVFPETRYIVKKTDGNFHGQGTLLKAGENNYRPQLCGHGGFVCRWGDYSATSFDGAGNIWFAGEYANTLQLGPPQNGRNWGTWIGAISAS